MAKKLDKWYGKLKHEAVKIKRQAKAVAELETPFEKCLRQATSNKKWGCPNSVLHELTIDAETFKYRQKILARAWAKLGGNQEKWRRILKTLILLEYLLKNGSETIAPELRSEQMTFKRLTSYQCREDGIDRGTGVREKAEVIVKLLDDKDLLATAREEAKAHREKLTGNGPTAVGGGSRRQRASSGPGGQKGLSNAVGSLVSELTGETVTKKLSTSQANELEQRFNRLREERLAELAERESKGVGNSGSRDDEDDRRRGDAGPKADEDTQRQMPKEDSFGLFDPAFRPEHDSCSDSDAEGEVKSGHSKSKPPPPAADLLDMDGSQEMSAHSSSPPNSFPLPLPSVSQAAPATSNLMDLLDEPSKPAAAPAAVPASAQTCGFTASSDDFANTAFQSSAAVNITPTFSGGVSSTTNASSGNSSAGAFGAFSSSVSAGGSDRNGNPFGDYSVAPQGSGHQGYQGHSTGNHFGNMHSDG
eukprot:TRINITY_DN10044_c0_g1_i1.p1 TRINITY_DN10044_c0_g1~~TRINITY_DN10044_c0_g1_i1.p1  ORF type:complete len:476 (-),score=108.20 TRINITY_DN10044_c0_g1_i1:5-1432(-)